MRCEKGAIAQNLDSMAACLTEASRREIDVLGFPEMCLTGYANPIQSPEVALRLDGPEMADLLRATQSFQGTVLAGLIEANPAGKPFITHIVARQGQLLGAYRKVTIKDDEVEWFSPGKDYPIFQHDTLPFGIAICADLSTREVFAQGHRHGAQLMFELAAPGLYGEQETRDWGSGYRWWESECQKYLSQYAHDFGMWVLVATQAGRTKDEDFPGGGFVFAPGGERVFATADGSSGAVFIEIDLAGQMVKVLP